jgi:hypothetical protein
MAGLDPAICASTVPQANGTNSVLATSTEALRGVGRVNSEPRHATLA